MKRIKQTAVAGISALAIGGIAVGTALTSNASPLSGSLGGALECSYTGSPSSMSISGTCGSSSALGTNGGSMSGQIDRANRSAGGDMALNTATGSLSGKFKGTLTEGGTLVGEFTPSGGSVGIPFTAVAR